jgi:Family of unknown function (DUF6174)
VKKSIVFFLAIAASVLCSNSAIQSLVSAKDKPFDINEFNRNREIWTNSKTKNYKMVIGAFWVTKDYSEQVQIEVRESKKVSLELLWDSGGGNVDAVRPFDTMERFFDFIEELHRRNPKQMTVRYHSELGYPMGVKFDLDGQKKNGDEIMVNVKKMTVDTASK